MRFAIALLISILLGGLSTYAEENPLLPNESGYFPMSVQLESESPAIKEYEIEFWRDITDKTKAELPILMKLNAGRNIINAPREHFFFRVRAVTISNIRGHWTEFYPIKRYPLKKETSSPLVLEVPKPNPPTDLFLKLSGENGKEVLYLTSPLVNISELSGKKTEVFYRINDVPTWIRMNENGLLIEKDGFYVLDYYSRDQLGNRESSKQISFIKDFTPPETRLIFNGDSFQNAVYFYLSPETFLSLDSLDAIAGVDKVFYRYHCSNSLSSDWTEYRQAIPFKSLILKNCEKSLNFEFYSKDKIGNSEKVQHKVFHLTNTNAR